MGPLWRGSTALQRLEGFRALPQLEVRPLDSGARVRLTRHNLQSLWRSVCWKLGWPADVADERGRLLSLAKELRPNVIFVDSSRVVTRGLLRRIRAVCDPLLVYYIPDDAVARHNVSRQLVGTFPEWDLFFTTKTFNVPELEERGVRRPTLIGKAFDPKLHRPLSAAEVGSEYERYDVVFLGTYERERFVSVNRLAQAGFSVIVFSNNWPERGRDPRITLRPLALAEDYTRGMHVGKVALCFLRKINRDRITQRSVEIPAMERPMIAERTDEHNAHFEEGREYMAFGDDDELVAQTRKLLSDPDSGGPWLRRGDGAACSRAIRTFIARGK